MYCCLAGFKCAEEDISESRFEKLKDTIQLHLNSTDQFLAVHRRIFLLTYVDTYVEVKKKLNCIQEHLKKHDPSVKAIWGCAEIKDDDILTAIDGANQMMRRTTDEHPISILHYGFACL